MRHHLRRQGQADGPHVKPIKVDAVDETIRALAQPATNGPGALLRPINVRALLDWLVLDEQGYAGSYKSVLCHMRKGYPEPMLRPFCSVETPGERRPSSIGGSAASSILLVF